MYSIVAHSEDINSESAVRELLDQCEGQLNGRSPKGGIVLSAIDFEFDVILEAITSHWPNIELIGGTTDGEISSSIGCTEDSIVLTLFGGEDIDVQAGIGLDVSKDIEAACKSSIEMALGKSAIEPQFCITIPESLTTSGQKIVESLTNQLGDRVPVLGALAGDQWNFSETKQFFGDRVISDSVPILLFSGALKHSYGIATGWKPIGEPGTVTSSNGSVVRTINDKPAIEFFEKYLGKGLKPSGENPLVIINQDGNSEYLRATIGNVDEESGSVTFLADVEEGLIVKNTFVDRQSIVQGCAESVQSALNRFPEGHKVETAIVFSCSARKLLLGTKVNEEYEQIKSILGDDVSICGFYGYGEISPNAEGRPSRFHNESFVTLLLGS